MLLPTEHLGHVNKKYVVLVTPLKYLGSIGTYSLKKKIGRVGVICLYDMI